MATSGSTSVAATNNHTLKFSWWQNSQSVANNNTVIGWKLELIADAYGVINSSAPKDWAVTVNSTKYSGTNTIGLGKGQSKTLASGTTTIGHNADGTKTFSYSFSQDIEITYGGSWVGTKSGSGSGTLNTIARASQPSCITWPNTTYNVGNIGGTITIHMNSASGSFTHTVRYSWHNKTGTIATNVVANCQWTIPMNFCDNLPSATKGWGTIYVDTYSGSTLIGTKSVTFEANVPTNIIPSISNIAVSEGSDAVPSGYGFVQGHSKLRVVTTSGGSYSSTITKVEVTFDGVKYTGGNIVTNIAYASGNRTISVTVTDSRGRTYTKTATVSIQAYAAPQIALFTAERCNEDGLLNEQGEYMLLSYNASITALNNKNGKSYIIRYKKSSETNYTSHTISATSYAVSGTVILPADSGSSYNVSFDVSDTFVPVTKNLMLSTAFTILNFKADGTGIGAGKVSEESNVFDFGLPIKPNKGFAPIPLVEGTDLNDVMTPNMYYCKDGGNATYKNSPLPNATTTFTLEVKQGGNNGFTQIITTISKDSVLILQRAYYSGSWGDWNTIYTNDGKVLWSGALLMTDTETITLSEQVKAQANGIVLIFSAYADGESKNYDFQDIFVSKFSVAQHSMNVRSFVLGSVGFWQVGCKALSISNGQIFGDYRNDDAGTQNGITYNNAGYCLRYVIGV